MAKPGKAPRAAGTYGLRDVTRNRPAISVLRDVLSRRALVPELPGRAESEADVAAFRRGASRIVSCHLRGSLKPYPQRLTYGYLLISASEASWKPYLRLPWRHPIEIDFVSPWVQTRPPGLKELNIDHGTKICEGVMESRWIVVTARNSSETIDFVVPFSDVPLVTAWVSRATISEKAAGPD
jgi:hypothetical protein